MPYFEDFGDLRAFSIVASRLLRALDDTILPSLPTTQILGIARTPYALAVGSSQPLPLKVWIQFIWRALKTKFFYIYI